MRSSSVISNCFCLSSQHFKSLFLSCWLCFTYSMSIFMQIFMCYEWRPLVFRLLNPLSWLMATVSVINSATQGGFTLQVLMPNFPIYYLNLILFDLTCKHQIKWFKTDSYLHSRWFTPGDTIQKVEKGLVADKAWHARRFTKNIKNIISNEQCQLGKEQYEILLVK